MNQDYSGRQSSDKISIVQMKKSLNKLGIILDRDTNIEHVYNQLVGDKGNNAQIDNSNSFRYSAMPSDSSNKLDQRQSMENKNYNDGGNQQSNLFGVNDNRPPLIQSILNVMDQQREKRSVNTFAVVEQSNSDITLGKQSFNQYSAVQSNIHHHPPQRNEQQQPNDLHLNEDLLSSDNKNYNQNSARQNKFQVFNFGLQGQQSGRNSLQNQGNRASSASMNSNRQSGLLSQRNSQDHFNRLSNNEPQPFDSGNNKRFNNLASPVMNQGNRSSSNSAAAAAVGGQYIPNDNSSRRVSNQSYLQSNNNLNAFQNRQQTSPYQNRLSQPNYLKNAAAAGDDGKPIFPPIQASAESKIYQRQLSNEGINQSSNIFTRAGSFTEQKYYGNSLMGTARALSQSQRKQTNQQKQNDSLLNLTKFALFGDKRLNQKNSNMSGEEEQLYYQQQQQARLNIKNRFKILISRIETSHVVMFILIALFSLFFLSNIYEYLTFKPELQFCDSTLRTEQLENSIGLCIPCPVNAVCLNGNVKCKQSYVLVDKKCIINPQIEPNTIIYINTVVENLQYMQAQYYCYDSNSSGYGNNISRPYKEHKWDSIVKIITTHHNRDALFYDTLSKVQELLKSRSIREQFDINFDHSRETYYVTTFSPSIYCRIRLQLIQNVYLLIGAFCFSVLVFIIYQLKSVRKFIYQFKVYKEQEKLKQMNQSSQIQNGQQNIIGPNNNTNNLQFQNQNQAQFINANVMEQQQLQQQKQLGNYNQKFQTPQQQQYEQSYPLQQQQFLQVPQSSFQKLDSSLQHQPYRRNRQS